MDPTPEEIENACRIIRIVKKNLRTAYQAVLDKNSAAFREVRDATLPITTPAHAIMESEIEKHRKTMSKIDKEHAKTMKNAQDDTVKLAAIVKHKADLRAANVAHQATMKDAKATYDPAHKQYCDAAAACQEANMAAWAHYQESVNSLTN